MFKIYCASGITESVSVIRYLLTSDVIDFPFALSHVLEIIGLYLHFDLLSRYAICMFHGCPYFDFPNPFGVANVLQP